jgi:hypothetical protein
VGHFLFGQIAVGCDIDMVGVLGGGAGSQSDSRGTRNTRCDWSIDRNRWTAPATALGRRRPKHIISRLKLSNNILNQDFGSGKGQWIRIRILNPDGIQEVKNDSQKYFKKLRNSCFQVLNVLFLELKASFLT